MFYYNKVSSKEVKNSCGDAAGWYQCEINRDTEVKKLTEGLLKQGAMRKEKPLKLIPNSSFSAFVGELL